MGLRAFMRSRDHPMRGLETSRCGYEPDMHRKLVHKLAWTGLYAGVSALATVAARRVASRLWRAGTGEAPPAPR